MGKQDNTINKIHEYGNKIGFKSDNTSKIKGYFKFNENCSYSPDVVYYLEEIDRKKREKPYCIFEVEWAEGNSLPALKGLIGAICFAVMKKAKYLIFTCNDNNKLINDIKGRIQAFNQYFSNDTIMDVWPVLDNYNAIETNIDNLEK